MWEDIYDKILFTLEKKPSPSANRGVWESPALASEIGVTHSQTIDAIVHLKSKELITAHFGQREIDGHVVQTASLKISAAGKVFRAKTSFWDEKKKEDMLVEFAEWERIKLEQDIKINSWLLRTKWWPLIISIISLAIAVYAAYRQK